MHAHVHRKLAPARPAGTYMGLRVWEWVQGGEAGRLWGVGDLGMRRACRASREQERQATGCQGFVRSTRRPLHGPAGRLGAPMQGRVHVWNPPRQPGCKTKHNPLLQADYQKWALRWLDSHTQVAADQLRKPLVLTEVGFKRHGADFGERRDFLHRVSRAAGDTGVRAATVQRLGRAARGERGGARPWQGRAAKVSCFGPDNPRLACTRLHHEKQMSAITGNAATLLSADSSPRRCLPPAPGAVQVGSAQHAAGSLQPRGGGLRLDAG